MDDSKVTITLKKLEKQLEETFVDEVRAASDDALKSKIVHLSKEIEDVQDEKKADSKLEQLREDLKLLSSGYTDLIKDKKKRIQLVLLILEQRGKL